MAKLKQYLTDWRYIKISLYVVLTAGLLYILYFLIKNFDDFVGGLFGGLNLVLTALSPLLIGLFLAYLLNPVVEWMDRRVVSRLLPDQPTRPRRAARRSHNRRLISVLLTVLLVLAILCLIIYCFAFLIIGQLAFDSLSNMLTKVTGYFLQYKDIFTDLMKQVPNSGLEEKLKDLATGAATWISEHFSANSVFRYIGNLGGSLFSLFLGLIVAVYLLKDKLLFVNFWNTSIRVLFKPKAGNYIHSVLSDINTVFSKFLRGQLLDALIVAVLASILLTAIGLDFSVLIGCFAGLANVIPYFGPIIGAIPAAIVGLLNGGITKALLAVGLLLILQQIDGNLIYPKVVGTTTGLHPVAILVAVSFGSFFWGLPGMLLAVPITACLKLFGLRFIKSRQIIQPLPEEQPAGADAPNQTAGEAAPNQTAGTDAPNQPAGADAPNQTAGADTPNQTAGEAAPNQTAGADAPNQTAGTDKQ